MSQDKISICLPIYNGSQFIASAIESVLAQSHQNWELLVADDRSSDQSADIAQSFADRDSRIKFWKNERNHGLFANYNECIKQATGDYIKPFAQDDLLKPTCLEKLVLELGNHPKVLLATCARAVVNEAGEETGVERFFDQTLTLTGEAVIAQYMRTFVYKVGTPSQVMFHRRSIGKAFDPTFYLSGDIEYFFRIIENGDYLFLNEVLIAFRRHSQSATVTMLKDMSFVSDSFRLYYRYRDLLQDEQGKVPLVHKPLIEGLIRKVNNAVYDRKIDFDETVADNLLKTSAPLDFKLPAYQLLLYAAELHHELEKLKAQSGQKAAELKQELQEKNRMLEQLQESSSWRLTEPLRRLKKGLSGN
jgi:glycosyltransferase involved in cell wall biosynthesis